MQCIEVKKNADNDNKNIIIIFERGFNSQYVLLETRPLLKLSMTTDKQLKSSFTRACAWIKIYFQVKTKGV